MKAFIKWMDDAPFILKIIFCIPVLDIVWAIYRIVKGLDEKNTLLLVVGIIWVIGGCTITWLVDIITTVLHGKPILS